MLNLNVQPAAVPSELFAERRSHLRQDNVMKIGLVHSAEGKVDLCVICNASQGGLLARVYRQMIPGEVVWVELRNEELIECTVRWTKGRDVGLQFVSPVDLDSLLSSRWRSAHGGQPRMPRAAVNCLAMLRDQGKRWPVRVLNISQGGVRLEGEQGLPHRPNIVLTLPDMGIIPSSMVWVHGNNGGLRFHEQLEVGALARWLHQRAARVA